MDPVLTFAGFLVGIVVGLCGVGGGALMTPFLIHYGITPAIAVGTDLAYALFSKSTGAWLHHRRATVRWRIVALLALGSLPASVFCTVLLGQLSSIGVDYQGLICNAIGLTLILTGLAMLLAGRGGAGRQSLRETPLVTGDRGYQIILTGVLLGFLVTLTSIGSGAVCAAALVLLFPRMPAAVVVGTDLAHAVPLVAIAMLGHLQLGNVDLSLLGSLLPGVIPGVLLGTKLGTRLPDLLVRRFLAVALLGAGSLTVVG